MNILSNDIGTEQANELIKIMESHSNLKTLCGFRGNETELDLSNKNLGAGCVVLVASEIKNIGALETVNLNNNNITLSPQLCARLTKAVSTSSSLCMQIIEGNDVLEAEGTMAFELLKLLNHESDKIKCVDVRSEGLTGLWSLRQRCRQLYKLIPAH